ncbi:MAG: hypothetical protein RL748_3977 [Pseudomonadota bacterium]|jgi:hypothetical protein
MQEFLFAFAGNAHSIAIPRLTLPVQPSLLDTFSYSFSACYLSIQRQIVARRHKSKTAPETRHIMTLSKKSV